MSLTDPASVFVINHGALSGMLKHRKGLDAHCSSCDRWAQLDLATLVAAGHGGRSLPLPVRCLACGERGELQVRPPVPTRGPGGWMESN